METSKETTEIAKELTEMFQRETVENAVNNNVGEFEILEVPYRVSKPTYGQKQKTYKKRAEKFTELIQDKTLMLEKDLKKQYKERGIDIDEMQTKIISLEREKHNIQLKLGEALVKQASDTELKAYKEQIEEIQAKQINISIEKTNLLDFTIEQQLFVFTYTYLTFLIAEKKVDDKWVKVWNTWEDFENSDEDLIKEISYHASLIMKDELSL